MERPSSCVTNTQNDATAINQAYVRYFSAPHCPLIYQAEIRSETLPTFPCFFKLMDLAAT
jgi:hypothetical protein